MEMYNSYETGGEGEAWNGACIAEARSFSFALDSAIISDIVVFIDVLMNKYRIFNIVLFFFLFHIIYL